MNGSGDEAVALHLAERLGQHLLADADDVLAQSGKPQLTFFLQYLQNQHGPFVGDAADQLVDESLDPRIEVDGRRARGMGLVLRNLVGAEPNRPCHADTLFLVSIERIRAYSHLEIRRASVHEEARHGKRRQGLRHETGQEDGADYRRHEWDRPGTREATAAAR